MIHAVEVATDLRNLFGPVRDQGARPTCLAFAASDTHAGLRNGWVALSCEFAFYHAQRRAGRPPTKGAVLSFLLDALRYDGQPTEDAWPYLEHVPTAPGAWKPPDHIGPLFGRAGIAGGGALTPVISSLEAGRPLILLLILSPSFFSPNAAGVVTPAAAEAPDPALRHAVIAVGYGTVDGQTAILVRNSWGSDWGAGGHAWLTEGFLTDRLFATAALTENVDVSPHPTAA